MRLEHWLKNWKNLLIIKQAEQQKEDNGLISLEKLFGEDTQVDRLTRQVREQGGKNRATAERNFCSAEREKVIFRIQKTLARAKITNDMSEIATNLENTRV